MFLSCSFISLLSIKFRHHILVITLCCQLNSCKAFNVIGLHLRLNSVETYFYSLCSNDTYRELSQNLSPLDKIQRANFGEMYFIDNAILAKQGSKNYKRGEITARMVLNDLINERGGPKITSLHRCMPSVVSRHIIIYFLVTREIIHKYHSKSNMYWHPNDFLQLQMHT